MLDQNNEAVVFVALHSAEVEQVRDEVLAAAQRFVSRPDLAAILPESVHVGVAVAIRTKNPELARRVIRTQASTLVNAGLSDALWAMVDAANFWMDATSAAWKYMTQARRAQSLEFASEIAAQVR